MKDIMCPFFREPCLREGCTAFENLEYTNVQGLDVYHARMSENYHLIHEKPYCNALKVDLPEGR